MNSEGKCSAKVVGILLAAGASSRLGQPKQLLPFQGKPLVRRVAEAALASRLVKLIVVVGNQAAAVADALEGLPAELVENADFLQGQSTSLRAGVAALPADLDAALVLLVDQPFVDAALIDRLIDQFESSGAPMVAPEHAGQRGNPVLFAAVLLPEFAAITGDVGARDVIRRHREQLSTVPLEDARAFMDVDTWEDYERVSRS
ncbi:MAG TPA: nucleotidyltransferase family protein [Chloroflexota bacterium]|nr:nucleotidyltransferase family protein [Chloroflexota bacterium]